MSDVEHEEVEEETEISLPHSNSSVNNHRCVNLTLQIIFSTPGLVVLVVIYSIMGALIFPLLEAPSEIQNAVIVSNSREECLKELWTITERLNVLYEKNWTTLVHAQLQRFERSIVAATKGGLIETMGDRFPRWSFSEALLYSVTVITTIGHGNLTPRTSEGKIVTMLYALVGVPLMLMCLSSLGGFLADALQCAYTKICNVAGTHIMEHNGNELNDECRQSGDEIDCNICKYDVVCKETELQTYDKYTPVTNDREDASHLIRNSPIKSTTSTTTSSPQHHSILCSQTLKNTNSNSAKYQQQQYLISRDSLNKHHLNQINHHLMETSAATVKSNANTYFPQPSINCCMQQQQQQEKHHQQIYQQNHNLHQLHNITVGAAAGPQQINSNYQGIQLQNHLLQQNKCERTDHQLHQQQQQNKLLQQQQHTATVHGLGRSKFLPKPLPQEINVLLAECDANCHHHELTTDTTTTTTTSSQVPNLINKCGGNSSMETLDEDDDDDNRTGCNHGTPSRIPLIKQQKHKRQFSSIGGGKNGKGSSRSTATENNSNNVEDDDTDKISQTTNNPQVPITIILIILIIYICIGTVIFSLWENWSIVDGAYFCFVTLSTIGFGDLVPKKTFRGPELQLFACCAYLLLGLVLVAMSFSLLETQLLWKCRRMAVRLKLAKD